MFVPSAQFPLEKFLAESSFVAKVYRRKFKSPLQTAREVKTFRDGILLRIIGPGAIVLYREVAPLPEFGTETLVSALALLEEWQGRFPRSNHRWARTHPCLDFALGSLSWAEETNGAGHQLKDIEQRRPVVYLAGAVQGAADRIRTARSDGFTVFKLKIGVESPALEIARMTKLVETLQPGESLRLDANQSLDLSAARAWVDAAGEWPVEFLEEPLVKNRSEDLVRFSMDSPVRLALDESVFRSDDLCRWLDTGWPGFFVIKPLLMGNPLLWDSEAARIPERIVLSSSLETAVGQASALPLAWRWQVGPALGFGADSLFAEDGFSGVGRRATVSLTEVRSWGLAHLWERL